MQFALMPTIRTESSLDIYGLLCWLLVCKVFLVAVVVAVYSQNKYSQLFIKTYNIIVSTYF